MGSSSIHSKQYRAFVRKLRKAREDSGLTQRAVAELLGKTQSFMDKCERGERRVDAAELFEFARVYGKPLEFFDPGSP